MAATLDSDPGDRWVPLAQAADQLGVSRDALRRRIRRGTLPSRQVETRYGPTYEVQISEASATLAGGDHQGNGHHPGVSATVTTATLDAFATLVRDLSDRSERNAAAAAMWQARAELLAGQVERLQLALDAPREPASQERPISSDSEHAADEPPETPAATAHGRPWWRLW
jgi:hypothetical protein